MIHPYSVERMLSSCYLCFVKKFGEKNSISLSESTFRGPDEDWDNLLNKSLSLLAAPPWSLDTFECL